MCVVFIGSVVASCVGLDPLNSVRLGYQGTGLQKLLATDVTWQSNWIKEHEKNLILCNK